MVLRSINIYFSLESMGLFCIVSISEDTCTSDISNKIILSKFAFTQRYVRLNFYFLQQNNLVIYVNPVNKSHIKLSRHAFYLCICWYMSKLFKQFRSIKLWNAKIKTVVIFVIKFNVLFVKNDLFCEKYYLDYSLCWKSLCKSQDAWLYSNRIKWVTLKEL